MVSAMGSVLWGQRSGASGVDVAVLGRIVAEHDVDR